MRAKQLPALLWFLTMKSRPLRGPEKQNEKAQNSLEMRSLWSIKTKANLEPVVRASEKGINGAA